VNQEKTDKSPSNAEEFLKIARDRFNLSAESEAEIRRLALEDLEFRAGNQWPDDIKRERDSDGRPCLVINRIPQFVRQITNDQRQNRPSIKVHPVDSEADVETAKILQGLIRHIEVNSGADTAYDTAFEGSVTSGRGWFRILTNYVDPMSFDQEILIKRIRNPFSVYPDPFAQEPDGSDMNWCFIADEIPIDDFKAQYPDAEMATAGDWQSIGDGMPGWATKDSCRVVEYFYKDFKDVELNLMSDGSVVKKEDLPKQLPSGISIVNKRKARIPTVKWCKLNAVEVLEETEWLCEWIPLIPVIGDELDVNGERILEGIVRHAKDPQRMYNYWTSSETETIALAPRVPYIGVEGQFEGHQAKWKTANKKNHAYLEYKGISVNGQPVGPPQRQVYEPPVQAITNAKGLSADDLKATTGIYDSALGNSPNDSSGVAIQRRNTQTQTSNFHFVDNLTRSLKHAGRILVAIIPKVYDTARAARIIGDEDQEELVLLNQLFDHNGKQVTYNLGIGKYDVTVDTGPSFQTKRQEAAASMMDVSKANPQIMQVAGDLLVKNMDWPGADQIAERIKKTLPPGLADDDKNQQQPVPPQIQAHMQQMNQMIGQLSQKYHEAQDVIDTKKMELDSRERIAAMQVQAEVEIALAKMNAQGAQELLKHEVSAIQHRLDTLTNLAQLESKNNQAPAAAAPMPDPNQMPTGGPPPGQPMEGQQP
jgi:hypothetical protein